MPNLQYLRSQCTYMSKQEIKKAWKRFDSQTKKVYNAEHILSSQAELSKQEVVHFVAEICRGPLWQKHFKGIKLRIFFTSRGSHYAYGGISKKKKLPFIALPENRHGRMIHTIVHEMAHAIDHKNAKCSHGPSFCRSMLRLMQAYEGDYFAKRLKRELIKNKAIKGRTTRKP